MLFLPIAITICLLPYLTQLIIFYLYIYTDFSLIHTLLLYSLYPAYTYVYFVPTLIMNYLLSNYLLIYLLTSLLL